MMIGQYRALQAVDERMDKTDLSVRKTMCLDLVLTKSVAAGIEGMTYRWIAQILNFASLVW